jgi:hypothetical protein
VTIVRFMSSPNRQAGAHRGRPCPDGDRCLAGRALVGALRSRPGAAWRWHRQRLPARSPLPRPPSARYAPSLKWTRTPTVEVRR